MTANEVLAPVEALAGSRETNGANDTPVNKHYTALGAAYCGYTVLYGFEMSGNGAAVADCPSVIWVPTFRAWAAQNWERVDNDKARRGDVFFYKTQHTGFIFAPFDGRIVITLEGNAIVCETAVEARASSVGDSGRFEGIGFKKRYLTDDFQVYRPPYTVADQGVDGIKPVVGVDVSWWNGFDIDWQKVREAGVEFAMIRAGRGAGKVDETAEGNAKRAHAAGVGVGYYWFSYAATADEARAEADALCNEVERIGVPVTYPLAFDYEYDSEEKAPPQESIVEIARAFLARVKERGYYPINYTNIDYLGRGFDQLTDEYDTWLAHWCTSAPGRDCGIWQYTSTGSVTGIPGNVDINRSMKDYPAIIGVDGPASEPTPDQEATEEKCMTKLTMVSYGMSGKAVESVQALLNLRGYNCGTVDGEFGDKTKWAVKSYQVHNALSNDGVVGPQTWGSLIG